MSILMVTGLKDMSRCQRVFELAWASEAVMAQQAAAFSIAANVLWWEQTVY
jgi:hypothetical protein